MNACRAKPRAPRQPTGRVQQWVAYLRDINDRYDQEADARHELYVAFTEEEIRVAAQLVALMGAPPRLGGPDR
jgi:hypothetical protein